MARWNTELKLTNRTSNSSKRDVKGRVGTKKRNIMWQKTTEKKYYMPVRRSLLSRIVQRGLDLLQTILLLTAFLMFFSYVQVATATESQNQIKTVTESALYLLKRDVTQDKIDSEILLNTPVASMLKTDLGLRVSNTISRATLTQAFSNTTGESVEGLYFFPLPKDAVLEVAQFTVGGQVNERVIRPSRHTSSKDFPNMFVASIGTISPDERVLVRMVFQQPVTYSQGQYQLRMPMAFRQYATYTAANYQPVALHIELDAGFPLSDIESLSHEIHKSSHGVGRYSIRFKDEVDFINRDFVLVWTPEPSFLPQNGLGSSPESPVYNPQQAVSARPITVSTSSSIEIVSQDRQENQIIPLSAQTGTDAKFKLLIGLICAVLALVVRAILSLLYSRTPDVKQRFESDLERGLI